MAVHIATTDASDLLAKFKKAIDDSAIITWSYDSDGDFTHTAKQWRYEAWLRPSVEGEELRLNILGPKGETMSKVTYAVYHGRFIEAVLSHFDLDVDLCTASSMPEEEDNIITAVDEEG